MNSPELRLATLVEIASIRSALNELQVHRNRPFGQPGLLHRYIADLEALLARLEQGLREHEQSVLDRVNARRYGTRSR